MLIKDLRSLVFSLLKTQTFPKAGEVIEGIFFASNEMFFQ